MSIVRRSDAYIPKLQEVFAKDFLIGAAVNTRTIESSSELLAYHFASLTAENEMKFGSLHPEENIYTFEDADKIAAFARSHGKKLRGHTLVWHNQTSDWVFQQSNGHRTDRQTLLTRMKSHIHTVMKRYRNDIYCWDVVNEAIADEGPQLLRDSKWLEIIGPDFIAKAFEYAHEVDPQALLFYNDYNECHPEKRDKIITLIKSLQEQSIPIHGIGLQAHWNLSQPSMNDIRTAIERYAGLGLKIQITEMDISVFDWEDRRTDLTEPTEEMITRQAELYERIVALFREYREVITGITFWGAADDYTWLDDFPVRGRKNWPFLFDTNHQPKPAFWRVIE
jgi:endo-1,4-beta-xylanase